MSATGIGAAVRRKEDQRFITGKGRYTADIERPGQAYAYFVRSPHAFARMTSIDVEAARAAPGVVGVLTANDMEGVGNLGPCTRPKCRSARQNCKTFNK